MWVPLRSFALLCLAAAAAHSQADFDTAKIDLNGVWASKPKDLSGAAAQEQETIAMGLFVHGLPARYVVRVSRVQVRLETPEGKLVPTTPLTGPFPIGGPDEAAVRAALGDVRLHVPRRGPFRVVPLYTMAREDLAKHWSDFLKFSATLGLQVDEYRVKTRAPFDPKSAILDRSQATVRIPMQGSETVTPESGGELVCVLINPFRKEALLGTPSYAASGPGLVSVVIDGVRAALGLPARAAVFPGASLRADGWTFRDEDAPDGIRLTDEWLSGAETAVLGLVNAGSLEKTFHNDRLSLSSDIPRQRGETSDYDAAALEKILLPENADKEQMREYAEAIVAVSRKQKRLGYEDPQVAMLKALGPENLDVLIDAAPPERSWKDLHIWKAMRDLVREQPLPAQCDLIIARLPAKPDLAELLVHPEWTEAAKPVLIKGLEDGRSDLPASWVKGILSFDDPATYPAVIACYLRNPTEPDLYETVSRIPGAGLGPHMPAAWEKAKLGNVRQQSFAIHPACEWGVLDAFATAAAWLRPGASDYQHRVGRAVFKRFAPVQGSDEELLAWHTAHQDSLVFDADRKMFLPRKSE